MLNLTCTNRNIFDIIHKWLHNILWLYKNFVLYYLNFEMTLWRAPVIQLTMVDTNWFSWGRRFETESRLSDGDVKGRSPDVNNHIWLIHVCKNLITHTHWEKMKVLEEYWPWRRCLWRCLIGCYLWSHCFLPYPCLLWWGGCYQRGVWFPAETWRCRHCRAYQRSQVPGWLVRPVIYPGRRRRNGVTFRCLTAKQHFRACHI